MRRSIFGVTLAALLAPMVASAQFSPAPAGSVPTKTTFVRLGNNANAIIVEPATMDPSKAKIGVVVSHPERINNFNYFIAQGMPQHGYRVIAINYYGPENSFYELLGPIAAGIKTLRAIPGVEKVVLAGHSTGAAQMSQYQDVAENGPKACQRPERIFKCTNKEAENLPKADAVMILDGNSGGPERTLGINPAFDPVNVRTYNEALDLFSPKNGYDPATGTAKYSPTFLKTFFAAQAKTVNFLIDDASARLAKVEQGGSEFSRDDQALTGGPGLFANATKPELERIGLLSRTHAPHMLLKADGTRPTQIISVLKAPDNQLRPAVMPKLDPEPELRTVKSYLSTAAIRLNPAEYRWTADNIYGVEWSSSASSLQGSIAGIHVPTLVMAANCTSHVVLLEIAYDRSPAADKQFVGLDGANHGLNPCRPEYGDTFKRAFEFVDSWLTKPGRL
jgi:pimeloyl-ACP methyl ester carboxylesterase